MIILSRSSLSGWSVGNQEAALPDVDYISFLFSSLTGFSSDKLASLQEAGDESALPRSPLSPLSLYPTPLEQFTHHWDIVEVCSLHSLSYTLPPNFTYILPTMCHSETLVGSEYQLLTKTRVGILDTAVVCQSPGSLSVFLLELRGWKLYHGTPAERGNFIALHRLEMCGYRA